MAEIKNITDERAARRFHHMAVLERQLSLKIDDIAAAREHLKELNEERDGLVMRLRVQNTLDDWLDRNPEAQKYVRKIYYVPDGAEIPRDVTHMNRLTSLDYPDLELRLGVVATLETAALANLILSLIERSAGDPKDQQGR